MTVFVDTSSFFATLSSEDERRTEAQERWAELLLSKEPLLTTNYVVLETAALVARRLGMEPVRTFESTLLPPLEVVWIDESLHRRGVAAFLAAGKRDLSLVDCVSFEVMRERGVHDALTFDQHFTQQGFHCL